MRLPAALLLVFNLLLSQSVAAEPSPPVTRGRFVVLVWETCGGVPYDAAAAFHDLARDDDCAQAVGWAYGLGLVKGAGGGLFEPHRPITREETALLLRRWADRLGRDTFLPDGVAACNDYADISPWADDSLYWATDTGLIDWSPGGRLDPYGVISEEEAAAILYRFDRGQP